VTDMAPILRAARTAAAPFARRLGCRVLPGELFVAALLGAWRGSLSHDPGGGLNLRSWLSLKAAAGVLDWLRDTAPLPRSLHRRGLRLCQLVVIDNEDDGKPARSVLALAEAPAAEDLRDLLGAARRSLHWRERLILRLHYDEHMDLREVAACLAAGPSWASRCHRKALARMRAALQSLGEGG
jgi:RNA polymerase sigma factor (sigma-70 family)